MGIVNNGIFSFGHNIIGGEIIIEVEKIELGKNWFIERLEGGIWFLVDKRDPEKAIPFPALKVRKGMHKGKILKQILDANELLIAQSDIVQDVFPRSF